MILSETSLVVGSPKIAFTCSFDAPSWILSKFSRASFEPDKAVEILELLQPVNPAAKRNRITNDERNCSRNIYFAITAFVFAPTWRSGFKEYCGDRTGIYSLVPSLRAKLSKTSALSVRTLFNSASESRSMWYNPKSLAGENFKPHSRLEVILQQT